MESTTFDVSRRLQLPPLGAIDSEQASADRRVRLKSWSRRTARSLGYRTPDDRPPPLIDQAHRLMHFWRAPPKKRRSTRPPAWFNS